MLTVSPTSAASRSQISRPCWVTSSRPDTALAKRKMPEPQPILASFVGLLDQFTFLERTE